MVKEQRLIDANALSARLETVKLESDGFFLSGLKMGVDHARVLLYQAPTVDAVEVVRCKDCKHYVQFLQDNKECRCTIFSGCHDRPYPTEPNDFCSYGERREEECL